MLDRVLVFGEVSSDPTAGRGGGTSLSELPRQRRAEVGCVMLCPHSRELVEARS